MLSGSIPRADFADFFAATWPDLVAFCQTLTGSAQLAEDLTQETLTRVFVRYSLLREPRPYAFRIAGNLVNRAWRQERLIESRDPASLPDGPIQDHMDHSIDAVRRLPDRLKQVVLLHYYADLQIDVIASVLQRPTGTIKRRLHEARRQLAVTLKEASE